MASEYAKLVLAVDSSQARTATRDVNNLARAGSMAEAATGSLTGFVGGLASSLFTAAAAGAALSKAISVQRQFDVINAGLLTATGSAQGAAIAFEALTDFAATTPYDLAQVSDSFIKLVNLGLDPSERALRSYGNTASAMGKDLNMMIEAVADAATGEFERLKEFGIKAKSEGDKVTLTFQGVKTTIGKNAAEIEQYLMAIGETKFGDAMSNRMDTLDGKLSNLADSWDAMFRGIMATDIGDGIEGMVDQALSSMEDVNSYLASGEFQSHINAMAAQFAPLVEDATEAFNMIWMEVLELNGNIEGNNPELEEALSRVWRDFPSNVRAAVQLATTYFAQAVEDFKIRAAGMEAFVKDSFENPMDNLWGPSKKVQAQVDASLKRNQQNYKDTIDSILGERQATIDSTKAHEANAAAARAAYDAKVKTQGDRLAGFGKGATAPEGASDAAAKKASDAAAKKLANDRDNLIESLRTEEEEIAASYEERTNIINRSMKAGSEQQIEMSKRSVAQRDRELQELSDTRNRDFTNLHKSLLSEEEAVQDSYDRRIEIINQNVTVSEEARAKLRAKVEEERQADLSALKQNEQQRMDQLYQGLLTEEEEMHQYHERRRTAILDATFKTEQERQELLRREEERFNTERMNREQDRIQMMMGSTASFLGSMSQLMAMYGKSQDKDAKKRWKMSQNFAMASAIVSTAAGVAKGLEKGFPVGWAEAAAAGAAGAVQIATIKSQQYSGSYDLGGKIPANKWGWVGEAGPEKVRGPASIMGRKNSERDGGGGGGQIISNVNVILQSDGTSRTESSTSGTGSDVETAREIGNMVSAKVDEALIQHQRPGGILWRYKHG